VLSGATTKYVSLYPPDWTFDEAELARAFNKTTRAIIINSPHNPTGKVFARQELEVIARLCQKWGVMAFTDEIYEHILFDGKEHVAIGCLPGMEELTVTINSLSKTYSVTGWRVGYIIACPELTRAIRKVHDFLTVGAPAPLQRAGVTAMKLDEKYYNDLAKDYACKRDMLLKILDEVGVTYFTPEGAYYVFSDISRFGFDSDVDFTQFLVKDVGVAVVPGSSFFRPASAEKKYVRFCFSRKAETLRQAQLRLKRLKKTT
ncbi:MAG: aminotransferase class I/II-fold pyridoxal phosphate-dependent enzyme, partial [Candidatus Melainabacteria bacterium]|nr:aminotransferase class I/II-fold pyridoxal phosphate-dependent enzyme [Candidatus Melainabacteria bacterium]